MLKIVEQPLGNIAAFSVGKRDIERVAVSSDDLAKRILRLEIRGGSLGLRLGEASLRDGDVVYADDERVVVVAVDPDDVLAVRPRSSTEAFELGHALGNRHTPAQLVDGEIVVAYDPLIEALLRERGAHYRREQRRLAQPFRPAHAAHGHEA